MRRVASSRPRRWGMDTIRGLDNSSLHGCERSYGGHRASAPAIPKGGSRSPIPPGLEGDARPLAGVAAIAIRVAIAHAAWWFQALAGRARSPKRRGGRACCPFPASHDPGHNRMLRDGRAASPCPAYAGRLRGLASSFARSRARSCRPAAPPPRRRSRVCSPWRVAPLVHVVPPRIRPLRPLARLGPTPPDGSTFRRRDRKRGCARVRNPGSTRLIAGRHGLCRILGRARRAWGEHTWPGRDDIKTTCTRSAPMKLKARLYLTVAAIGIASLLVAAPAQLRAQTAVAIDNDDIGGVVTGANGPEAGVWVIAETTDLPTRYAKIVV